MKIKAKIRLLNYLSNKGIIDITDFYAIGIEGYSQISLQGKFVGNKTLKYSKLLNAKGIIDDNGFVSIVSKNFKITLTQ
jgi:hypothetical protein